jgi:hypothetical protein
MKRCGLGDLNLRNNGLAIYIKNVSLKAKEEL